MNKLLIVSIVLVLLALLFWGMSRSQGTTANTTEPAYPVTYNDDEWKAKLSPEAYRILRQHSTERAGSSPLNLEKSEGDYLCAGCQSVLFVSKDKFDSGTGWPSFVQPASPASLVSKKDYLLMVPRTEVLCSECGGHLGHVFNDGPAPTGKRFCINGAALAFRPLKDGL